ncbi:cysteine proteinase [Neoconidiobolus thromboides FSU 785]|nr:cysteine proteinase [Neoconidiobolus thromboides FSU 785]
MISNAERCKNEILKPKANAKIKSLAIEPNNKGIIIERKTQMVNNGTNRQASDNSIPENETSISAAALIPILNRFNLHQYPTLLFIDVRPSHLFQEERMNVTQLVNIEPLVLKRNANGLQIESNLKLTNERFYKLFSKRHLYDFVIILDQNSHQISSNLMLDNQHSISPLYILNQALTIYEYNKKLKHVPILLLGGLEAWKLKTLDAGILRGCDNLNKTILGNEELSRRHAISQARSKNIIRSLNDYIQSSQSSDKINKQSMQFTASENGVVNNNIQNYSIKYQSNAIDSVNTSVNTNGTKSIKLQRRKTIFDNPYYGFTPTRKELKEYKEEIYIKPTGNEDAIAIKDEKENNLSTIPALTPTKEQININPLPIPPKPKELKTKDVISPPLVSSLSYAMNIGTTGLKNLGNTCYMNSILQCLNGTIPLARYFLDGSFKKSINKVNPIGYKGELAIGFHELVRTLWTESGTYLSPTKFKFLIDKVSSVFKGYEQQDSQEFLAFLLDGLHEDLNLVLKKPIFKEDEDDIYDKLSEKEASDLAWERHLQRDSSIIVSLFQGQLKSKLQCKICGKTSTTFNVFMYLSLPIPKLNQVNLLDCLNTFVKEETLDGDNAWNCPKCKCARPATKILTISRLPDVLLIHLKRFSYEGPFRNKLDTLVDFPLKGLDLEPFIPKYAPKSNILSPKGIPLGNSYDLYAVSNHYGSLTGGHYTAYVRSGYGGKWHCYDDSRVTIINEKEVITKAGYNLFYVRTNR